MMSDNESNNNSGGDRNGNTGNSQRSNDSGRDDRGGRDASSSGGGFRKRGAVRDTPARSDPPSTGDRPSQDRPSQDRPSYDRPSYGGASNRGGDRPSGGRSAASGGAYSDRSADRYNDRSGGRGDERRRDDGRSARGFGSGPGQSRPLRRPPGAAGFGRTDRYARGAYLTPKQERDQRRREREVDDDDEDRMEIEYDAEGRPGRLALRRKRKKRVRIFFHKRLTRLLLPKLLIKAKYLSPALARQFIEAGRVRVNARVVGSRFYEVNLRKERVTIDDVATEYPRRVSYMVYNKPRGVICEKGDTAFDELFDPTMTWGFPFGRLVKSVSGIVILSSDPRIKKNQHFVDLEIQKEYRIKINRHLSEEELNTLNMGVLVDDDYFVPLRVVGRVSGSHAMIVDITLLDDSYQKIFKALKKLGAEVITMRRSRIGLINDSMVPYGEWRELSGFEISALKIGRFTPGELPPEPDPPPFQKFERGRRFGGGGRRDGDGRPGWVRGGGPPDRGGDRDRGARDGDRFDRPRQDRDRGDRPRSDGPRDARGSGRSDGGFRRNDGTGRPSGDRPRDDRPRDDRPRRDGPRNEPGSGEPSRGLRGRRNGEDNSGTQQTDGGNNGPKE